MLCVSWDTNSNINLLEIFDNFQLWKLSSALDLGVTFMIPDKLKKDVTERLTLEFIQTKLSASKEVKKDQKCPTCDSMLQNESMFAHIRSRNHIEAEKDHFYPLSWRFMNEFSPRKTEYPTITDVNSSSSVLESEKVSTNVSVSVVDSNFDQNMEDSRKPEAERKGTNTLYESSATTGNDTEMISVSNSTIVETVDDFLQYSDNENNKWMFMCKVCGTKVPDESDKSLHLQSKGHLKKVGKTAPVVKFCELCKVNITGSENISQHDNGKKHKKSLRNLEQAKRNYDEVEVYKGPNLPTGQICMRPASAEKSSTCAQSRAANSNGIESRFEKEPSEPIGMCDKCNVEFKTSAEIETHLGDVEHNIRIEGKINDFKGDGGEKVIVCPVCRPKSFNGARMFERHLKGKDHVKRVKAKWNPKPKVKKSKVNQLRGATGISDGSANVGGSEASVAKAEKEKVACVCCQLVFVSESEYQAHLFSIQHKNVVEKISELVKPVSKQYQKKQFDCQLCKGVMICGQQNFRLHLEGIVHQRMDRLSKVDVKLAPGQ